MKMKSAWGNKLVACLTAAAMVVSSLAIPTVNVSAKETDDIAAETAEVSEAEAVAKAYDAATNTTKFYDNVQEAINSVTTAEGVVLSKDNVVTLLKDLDKDIIIKNSVTLDLNGKTIKGVQDGSETHNYGPIYLQNNKIDDANKNTVYIKNGIVIAEIDGAPGYNTDNNGQNEIYYTGDVVLENITLKPYMISETTDVPAVVWTDGHDFTLIGCDFSNATIQNINSIVTIKSGTYKALAKYGTEEDTYNVDGDRTFKLMGGYYDKDTNIDEYIDTGYVKDDTEALNKVEPTALTVQKNEMKDWINSLTYISDAQKAAYIEQLNAAETETDALNAAREAGKAELVLKGEEAKNIIKSLTFKEAEIMQMDQFVTKVGEIVDDAKAKLEPTGLWDNFTRVKDGVQIAKNAIDDQLRQSYEKSTVDTFDKAKADAKAKVEAQAAASSAIVDALDLSNKADYLNQIQAAKEAALGKIDSATSDVYAGIEGQKGIDAIKAIEEEARNAAETDEAAKLAAIKTEAKAAVDTLPNLSDAEKQNAKDAIDAATTKDDVLSKLKDAAKDAIAKEATNADTEIDALPKLTTEEKNGYKGNVNTEKGTADSAIDAADSVAGITSAVTTGKDKIEEVVDAAKAADNAIEVGTKKPGATELKSSTGHSITIVAAADVQYTLDKVSGPWYSLKDGKLYKDGVEVADNKDDANGVFVSVAGTITFTKEADESAALMKGKEYSVYSRYTDAAVAADTEKTKDVVDTKLPTKSTDAIEIAEAFKTGSEATTGSGFGKDEKAENNSVVVTVDESKDSYIVTLKQDVAGTITIPDTWGNVMIDLNGHDIVGSDGTQESPAGKQAIVLEDTDKEGTHLTVEDNSADKGGEIKGGNAYAGSGADGGDAIVVEEKNNNGTNSTLDIGEGVKVIGGNGADSNTDNGGNGGDAVDGNVEKNDGTLIGGNGGATDAKDKEGGNSGNGANGDITENNGVITGGNGGSSTNAGGGNGGDGADGVNGDVTKNNGTITGGNGGNSDNKTGGTGGDGVNGNVTDNTNSGTISGGNGGDSKNENGGNGGNGVDGTVGKNEGTISGGDGGDATGNGGNGGNGGSGTTGNVGENNGTIGGGNGGNSANGTGGNGGSGSNGTTGGNGAIKPGNNGTGESNPDGGNKMPAGLSPEEAEIWKNSESLESVEKSILNADTDKGDVKGSSFSRLRLRAIGKNKAIQLKWKKQSKADGYIIYGSACGSKMKKLKTIKKAATTSWTKKKLKKGKYYKYMVVAYKTIGKEKRVIAKSIGVHAVTKGGKYGNPEKVVIRSKKKLTLKKGKTAKIKATYTSKKKVRTHIRIIRFESSNKKVATVSKTGKIKAKKKGKCTIYVYAQNGIYKTVKVTVK